MGTTNVVGKGGPNGQEGQDHKDGLGLAAALRPLWMGTEHSSTARAGDSFQTLVGGVYVVIKVKAGGHKNPFSIPDMGGGQLNLQL